MATVHRTTRADSLAFDGLRRTPQGGVIVPAVLTRTGVFRYTQADGTVVREYRPPSEVMDAESLATLAEAPVTREHPPRNLTPDMFQEWTQGHLIGQTVKPEGNLIAGELVIQGADLLSDIEARTRTEVSCGYTCLLIPEPGVTPEGEEFDVSQSRIRYNHVAVTEKGRAGVEVCLRLDSAGNETTENERDTRIMRNMTINGIVYPINTPEELAIASAALAAFQATLAPITARADAAEKTVATRDARIAELEKALAKALRFDADDMELLAKARAILGADYNPEGKTPVEIMRDAVAKALPNKSLDGATDDYIKGLFDGLETPGEESTDADEKPADAGNNADEKPTEKADSTRRVAGAITPKPRDVTPSQTAPDARQAMIDRKRNAWQNRAAK